MILKLMLIFGLSYGAESMEYTCGEGVRKLQGVISTPNFPGPFPIPISCQWTIEAPEDHVIIVYFTQFYVRTGVRASEYVYFFRSAGMGIGETDIGAISADKEPTYLITTKPVLVLEMRIVDRVNVHMRVRESLLNVFGFNITYEIVPRNKSVRQDSCLYHHCSFNGYCLASQNHERYYCQCFVEYFGEECQYDSKCGPRSAKMCQNGGTCRYYIGSTVRTCECTEGYSGARCEIDEVSSSGAAMALKHGMKCESWYVLALPDQRWFAMNSVCETAGRRRYYVALSVQLKPKSAYATEKTDALLAKFTSELMKRFSGIKNVTVDLRSDFLLTSTFYGVNLDREDLHFFMQKVIFAERLSTYDFYRNTLDIRVEEVLSIQRIESSEKIPALRGEPLVLACIVRGSTSIKVTWFKDGLPLTFDESHQRIWGHTIPRNSAGQFNVLLGFDRTHVVDSGEFICKANDEISEETLATAVTIRSPPQPLVSPMAVTVREGDNFYVTCLSEEDVHGDFKYRWLKNGRGLNPSTDKELVEDIFPAGSRIVIESANESATYACVINSVYGPSSDECVATVLNETSFSAICPEESYWGVHWSDTAAGATDRKRCPSGYTGPRWFSLNRVKFASGKPGRQKRTSWDGAVQPQGFATRICLLDAHGKPVWGEGDFSGCLTTTMVSFQKEFLSLKMGYRMKTVKILMENLLRYLESRLPKMHPTEGEPVVDLLSDVLSFGVQDEQDQENWKIWKLFMKIASLIMNAKLVQKTEKLFKIQEVIAEATLLYAEAAVNSSVWKHYTPSFGVQVSQVPANLLSSVAFPETETAQNEESFRFKWIADTLNARLHRWTEDGQRHTRVKGKVTAVLAAFRSSVLFPQTEKTISAKEEKVLSHLLKVEVKKNFTVIQQDIEVIAHFTHIHKSVSGGGFLVPKNIFCVAVKFENSNVKYVDYMCETLNSTENSTSCLCYGSGTFTVLMRSPKGVKLPDESSEISIFALVTTTECLITVMTTLVALILRSRASIPVTLCWMIHLCASVSLVYFIFTLCLTVPNFQVYFPTHSELLQFLYLSAVILQPTVVLVVYMEKKGIWIGVRANFLVALLSWGVPGLVTACTGLTKAVFAVQSESTIWLKYGSLNFHIFTISVFFLSLLHIMLTVSVRTDFSGHQNKTLDEKIVFRRKFGLLWKAACNLLALLLSIITSVLFVNIRSRITEYAFSLSSVFLSIVIPICSTSQSPSDGP